MKKFDTLESIPAYLPIVNIDTDMIIPKQFLKTIKRTGLGKNLFFEMRYDEKNGILPITISEEQIKQISEYSTRKEKILIDLKDQKIVFGNNEIKFELDEFKKKCLIEGLDDIALSLEKSDKIDSFEKKLKSSKPWIFND